MRACANVQCAKGPDPFAHCTLVEELLGDADGSGGVGDVVVGPDATCVVLGEDGAPHQDLEILRLISH